jgi:peptidoglycan-associated lipoprotein
MSSHCCVRLRGFARMRARRVLLGGASYFRAGLILCVFVLAAFLLGCPNKTPVATATPPPPPPPAPVASIEVSPSTVQSGESVTITWKTENASAVTIEPLGAVLPSGSQTMTPTESTTYHLTAKGPGGVQESDARVTVTTAAAAPAPSTITEEDLTDAAANRLDVFFDSDQYSIRPDQFNRIRNDVDFFKQHPELQITVVGHCDELGSTEYNLALGWRRASEVKAALETAGVNAARIQIKTMGKEEPFCNEQSDHCMGLNRRAHFVTTMEP